MKTIEKRQYWGTFAQVPTEIFVNGVQQKKYVKIADNWNIWQISIDEENNSFIIINKNNSPLSLKYKVEESFSHVYKIMKTKIQAIGGAKGLFKFFEKELNESTSFYFKVLENILEHTKAVYI